jgi:hypothetical protein
MFTPLSDMVDLVNLYLGPAFVARTIFSWVEVAFSLGRLSLVVSGGNTQLPFSPVAPQVLSTRFHGFLETPSGENTNQVD